MGDLTEKVIFEQNLKEVSEVDIWGKTVLGRRNSSIKVRHAWHVGGIAGRQCGYHQKMYKYYYYIIML